MVLGSGADVDAGSGRDAFVSHGFEKGVADEFDGAGGHGQGTPRESVTVERGFRVIHALVFQWL